MKKSTKVMLFGGLILFAAGAIITVASIGFSGKDKLMRMAGEGDFSVQMENGTLGLQGLEQIGNVVVPFAGFSFVKDERYSKESGQVMEKTRIAEGADVRDLEIEFGAGDFEICESGDSSVYLEAHSQGKISYGVDAGHTLYLDIASDKKSSLSESTGCVATLYLPAELDFKKISIKMDAGELEVSEALHTGKLDLSMGAGEIRFADLEAEKAQIKIGAGQIAVANGSIDKLDLNIAAGQADYVGDIGEKLDADVAMGGLYMTLGGNEEDFDYDIKCNAGDISIGDITSSGLLFDKEIHEGREKKMEINCAMGNVQVDFAD